MRSVHLSAVLIGMLGLLACQAGPYVEPGGAAGIRFDDHRILGKPIRVGNLTVWPVHSDNHRDLGAFSTLDEAQVARTVTIRELGAAHPQLANPRPANRQVASHGNNRAGQEEAANAPAPVAAASVGEIEVANHGREPILIPGGTVVKGGKQDRQIGEDTVIPPGAVAQVKTFCVEQGRWTGVRQGQSTGHQFKSVNQVAAATVRYRANYDDDQSRVWQSVRFLNRASGRCPETGTYFALIDGSDPESLAEKQKQADAIQKHFAASGESVVGYAYAVNGQPVSVRTFAHPRLFQQHFESFLPAMCLEARMASGRGAGGADQPVDGNDVVKMVRKINRGAQTSRTTAAGNRVEIRRAACGAHGACWIPVDGTWVPVTEDWTANPDRK